MKKKKLLEKTIHDEDRKNDVPIYNEIFAASISNCKALSKGKLLDLGSSKRTAQVLDLDFKLLKKEAEEEEEEEEEGSSEDYSLLTQEMDNTEVLTPDTIADNDFDMSYNDTPQMITSDLDFKKKSNTNNNKNERKSANEKKLENENRKRTLLSFAEEGNRLEEDINQAEEERRTLCSDAVVVRKSSFRILCVFFVQHCYLFF